MSSYPRCSSWSSSAGVESSLAVHVRLVDVHARPVDRLGHALRLREHVDDHLHDRSTQPDRAGAADDETRPARTEHHRRGHHAGQPPTRLRGAPGEQVVLPEHVVQVHRRAGDDHAGAGPGRGRERGGGALGIDDGHVGRARRGRRLDGRRGSPTRMRPAASSTASGAEQVPCEAAAAKPTVEAVRAGPRLLAHHAHQGLECRRAPGRRVGQAVEQRQPVGDQDAAGRRRRVREHLESAEAHSGRAAARSRDSCAGPRRVSVPPSSPTVARIRRARSPR